MPHQCMMNLIIISKEGMKFKIPNLFFSSLCADEIIRRSDCYYVYFENSMITPH